MVMVIMMDCITVRLLYWGPEDRPTVTAVSTLINSNQVAGWLFMG
jgi:hypothetical protein